MKLKNSFKFCAVALIVFLSSCKGEKKSEVESDTSQMKEVMAIHDEVMPKMGSFGKLVSELKTREDSTELGLEYKAAREDLQAAHKSMMDWMRDFGDKFDSDEILNGKALSKEKQELLDAEEKKIQEVADAINSSLEKAENLLKQE